MSRRKGYWYFGSSWLLALERERATKTQWERERVILVTNPFVYICWLLAHSRQHALTVLSPPRHARISCCSFVTAIVWAKPLRPLCCAVNTAESHGRQFHINISYALFRTPDSVKLRGKIRRARFKWPAEPWEKINANKGNATCTAVAVLCVCCHMVFWVLAVGDVKVWKRKWLLNYLQQFRVQIVTMRSVVTSRFNILISQATTWTIKGKVCALFSQCNIKPLPSFFCGKQKEKLSGILRRLFYIQRMVVQRLSMT